MMRYARGTVVRARARKASKYLRGRSILPELLRAARFGTVEVRAACYRETVPIGERQVSRGRLLVVLAVKAFDGGQPFGREHSESSSSRFTVPGCASNATPPAAPMTRTTFGRRGADARAVRRSPFAEEPNRTLPVRCPRGRPRRAPARRPAGRLPCPSSDRRRATANRRTPPGRRAPPGAGTSPRARRRQSSRLCSRNVRSARRRHPEAAEHQRKGHFPRDSYATRLRSQIIRSPYRVRWASS